MSIPETIGFDKDGRPLPGGFLGRGRELLRRLFLAIVIILTAALAFGIGRLTGSGAGGEGVKIEMDPALSATRETSQAPAATPQEAVYASSKGTKYYYPSCTGVSRLSAANKISFPTGQAAEAAGYSLASGCTRP